MTSRRRLARVAFVAVACLGVLVVPALAGPAQESTAITAGDAAGTPGTNVTVDVSARAPNVSSYEARLTYDPDVVEVVATEGVDFSDPITNEERGRLNLTQVHVGGVDDPTFARITFRIVGAPGNATTLAFDEDDTVLFDAAAEDIWIDEYDSGEIRVEQPPTATPTGTSGANTTAATTDGGGAETATATDGSGGDGGSSGTDTPANGQSDDDESFLDRVLDESFLLGAGFVVLVVVVGGVGYYLGNRNSGSRTNW